MVEKKLEPNVITEISPLDFGKLKQYRLENAGTVPILIWVGTSNPHKGNESFVVEPKTSESRFFKGQQILAMAEKPTFISLDIK